MSEKSQKTQKESWFKGLDSRIQEDRVARQDDSCKKRRQRLFLYPWSWEQSSHY